MYVLLATTLADLPPDCFEVIGAGEQATAKKPAPEVYRWVLDGLGLQGADCFAIEDSRNGGARHWELVSRAGNRKLLDAP